MIEFTKVHGNGNDFIVLENLKGQYSSGELARFAKLLCRRKFSVGADGVLVIEPADGADFTMRIFNSDGSESEMCGNGARAVARYAFEKKLAGASMRFITLAGMIQASVEPPFAELDMGDIALGSVLKGDVTSAGVTFPFIFMTAGVPHCVLFTEDYRALDDGLKFRIGRDVSRRHDLFPGGANVSFAQAEEGNTGNTIRAVTYERGVEGLTESCGTGSVAAAIAAAVSRNITSGTPAFRVINPGGVNEVRLSFAPSAGETPPPACRAWLKGRTAMVAQGQILDDALFEARAE